MRLIKLLLVMFIPIMGFTQINVIHFNANWNSANDVKWVDDLENCKVNHIDIATDTDSQAKWEIVVVPTILIINEGEEVKRYQADISFTMKATKEEVQEKINDIYGDDF